MPVTVATFNVRHCRGLDEVVDVARVARVITGLDAAAVALQEVDRGLARSGEIDQVAALADATGLHVAFAATLRRAGGAYGIGLATRVPVETRFEPLPRSGREEPRGALVATVEGVTLVATHLSPRDPARRRHTEALASFVAGLPGPIVVLGDLNQGRRTLTPLLRLGFDPGPARPTHGGGRQIDFVLAGPGLALSGVRTVATRASDHLPLAADLKPAPNSF